MGDARRHRRDDTLHPSPRCAVDWRYLRKVQVHPKDLQEFWIHIPVVDDFVL